MEIIGRDVHQIGCRKVLKGFKNVVSSFRSIADEPDVAWNDSYEETQTLDETEHIKM